MDALITKLPSAVTDESMIRVGEAKFSFSLDSGVSAAARKIRVFSTSGSSVKCRIVGNAHFTDSSLTSDLGKELTVTANTNYDIYISDGEGLFFVNNDGSKDNIQTFILGDSSAYIYKYDGGFINEFNPYNLNVGRVNFTEFTIEDVLCAENPRFTNITLARTGVGGSTDMLVEDDSLTQFVAGGTALEGDILNFDKFKNLTILQIQNILGESRSNCKISGTVESLLDSIYSKGRTSGTLQVVAGGTDVTYSGQPISSALTFTFSAGGWSLNT